VMEKKVSNNLSHKKSGGGGLAGDVAFVLVVFVSLFGLDSCCFGKRRNDEYDDDDDGAHIFHPCLPHSTPGCYNWRDCRSHFFRLEWMVT